jgi:hypothetical protein
VEFRRHDHRLLLDKILEGDVDLTIISSWRLARFPQEKRNRLDLLTSSELPLYRICNHQIAVAGDLRGLSTQIQPFAYFYVQSCSLGLNRLDRVAYALTKMLAQISFDAKTKQPNLQVVTGSWTIAMVTLIEIAWAWLRLKQGQQQEIFTKQENEVIRLLREWAAKQEEQMPEILNKPTLETAGNAHDNIQKALNAPAGSGRVLFFAGNVATRLMAEDEYPVPVILDNTALELITNLSFLIHQSPAYLSNVFFPGHHVVSATKLTPFQRVQIERLKARWNYLVSKISPGTARLADASSIVDNVMMSTNPKLWRDRSQLFEQMIYQRCYDLKHWT